MERLQIAKEELAHLQKTLADLLQELEEVLNIFFLNLNFEICNMWENMLKIILNAMFFIFNWCNEL